MADLPTNAEEVKAVIQEVTKPAGFPGEFTLGDGTVVKATSWEEAFQKVADMKQNTSAALRDREEQIRQLKEAQQAPPEPIVPSAGFDQKHYWELMNADPIKAQEYMDANRFGVDPTQVGNLYREVFNASQYSADTYEINQFMQANPDFPGTDKASDIILNRLQEEGRPINKENLEYVYLRSVRDGLIEPISEEAPVPWTPPNMQGGGSRQDSILSDPFKDVPDDKLDEAARRLGLLKY